MFELRRYRVANLTYTTKNQLEHLQISYIISDINVGNEINIFIGRQ